MTVVDSFIPRAETLAKSKINQHNQHWGQQTEAKHHHEATIHYHRPTQQLTELQMGLFDMNPFHGSGSGGTKESLDEQVGL